MKINYFEKFVDNKVFIKIKNQDEKELFLEICSGKGLTLDEMVRIQKEYRDSLDKKIRSGIDEFLRANTKQ